MSDSISPREFREAEGTEDWRVVGDGARAYFTTGSFLAGAAFVAAIDLVEPLGADTLAHGTVEGTRIVVRLTGAQRVSEGRLPLRFDPAQRHYFDAASGARIESV